MILLFGARIVVIGADINVHDQGQGGDFVSGTPMTLPAASLSTNLFRVGAAPIPNRRHEIQAAAFDSSGALSYSEKNKLSPFPEYLTGNPYVSFSQDVRRYTNYSCTVSVDCPVTFYLLVDNRVNDFTESSSLDDPNFGPPDTEWITRDGWSRVNTGISPQLNGTNRGDYLCIYEGGFRSVSQFYAIYSKTFPRGGSVTVQTQFEGNIYCLVVGTNQIIGTAKGQATPKPAQLRAGG